MAFNRTVIKVGSSSLHDGVNFRKDVFDNISSQIAERSAQHLEDRTEFVIVTSGAIAAGRVALGLSAETSDIEREELPQKQAMASVGQPLLMSMWAGSLREHGINRVGQVLVTNDDLDRAKLGTSRTKTLRSTLNSNFEYSIVSVLNENDSTATDEIRIGDNDRLAARAANFILANKLFLLGNTGAFYEGYEGGSSGQRIDLLRLKNIPEARLHVTAAKNGNGAGGMATKLDAAEIFLSTGHSRSMYIADASEPNCLARAEAGEIGTRFVQHRVV